MYTKQETPGWFRAHCPFHSHPCFIRARVAQWEEVRAVACTPVFKFSLKNANKHWKRYTHHQNKWGWTMWKTYMAVFCARNERYFRGTGSAAAAGWKSQIKIRYLSPLLFSAVQACDNARRRWQIDGASQGCMAVAANLLHPCSFKDFLSHDFRRVRTY